MSTAASAVENTASPRRFVNVTLLPSVGAADDGDWWDAGDWPDGSLDVTISATATVQLRGSDAATKPSNTSNGNQIGSDITASGLFDLVRMPRWIKVKVSAWTSGTVLANATFRRQAI